MAGETFQALAEIHAEIRRQGYPSLRLWTPEAWWAAGHPEDDPSAGKVPFDTNWRELAAQDPPATILTEFDTRLTNIGVLCRGLRVIDFDVESPEKVEQLRALAVTVFGEAPVRVRSNSPRCAMLYRAGYRADEAPSGKLIAKGLAGKVEILSPNNQLQVYGRHYSGVELQWENGEPLTVPVAQLPVAPEDKLKLFIEQAEAILGPLPAKPKPAKTNGKANGHAQPTPPPQTDTERRHTALRYDAYVQRLLENIRTAAEGDKHDTLRDNGLALGGHLAAAGITPEDAHAMLMEALPPTVKNWQNARKTAAWALNEGQKRPLVLEDRPQPGWHSPPPQPPPNWEQAAGPEPTPADDPVLFDPWDDLQPPKFPIDAVPEVLREFIEDRSRVIGADPCGLAWAGLSACAAALSGSIRLRMKRHDTWTVPPGLWLALIGQSSLTMKTPIIEATWGPLERAQARDMADWKERLTAWKTARKEDRSGEEPKPKRRLVSHDGTMEALQDILSRQDRGIGVLRDELAGWIGSLEKYGGQKASSADRAFFLQAYNGGPQVVDRVTRGTVAINNLMISICGGIQPERLQQFADLSDDGLWQRFIPIIPAAAKMGVDEPGSREVQDYVFTIYRLLDVPGDLMMKLSDPAHEVRADVERRVYELVRSNLLGPRFASFCGKLAGLWGRLCIVLQHLEPTSAPHLVSLNTAERARTLLFESALPCAARVYTATGGAGADGEATKAVAGFILTKQKTRVLASELSRSVRACRGQSSPRIREIVSPLEAGGWLAPVKDWDNNAWVVAPGVHEQFVMRAQQEVVRRQAVRALITSSCEAGED